MVYGSTFKNVKNIKKRRIHQKTFIKNRHLYWRIFWIIYFKKSNRFKLSRSN